MLTYRYLWENSDQFIGSWSTINEFLSRLSLESERNSWFIKNFFAFTHGHQNDPLPGRIKVDFVIPKELPFGDKDTKSKVTLLEGDHVRFNISTDRRDKLERATNIEVLHNTFQFTSEAREMASIFLKIGLYM